MLPLGCEVFELFEFWNLGSLPRLATSLINTNLAGIFRLPTFSFVLRATSALAQRVRRFTLGCNSLERRLSRP